ncbi:hypothetical protein AALP_AA2G237700 [Arabis alpina]|uniref:Uncharacterized protein n=1 Tax=Arabis alpina TaxID=50452 RepID=A0A087HJJ5_ARAAL|nr:hypothetical protein AALP_AA2G237700 [Arabis alpina]
MRELNDSLYWRIFNKWIVASNVLGYSIQLGYHTCSFPVLRSILAFVLRFGTVFEGFLDAYFSWDAHNQTPLNGEDKSDLEYIEVRIE